MFMQGLASGHGIQDIGHQVEKQDVGHKDVNKTYSNTVKMKFKHKIDFLHL